MTVDNLVLKEFNIDKEATQRLQMVREIGVGIFSQNPGVPSIPIISLSDALRDRHLQAIPSVFLFIPFSSKRCRLVIKIEEEPPSDWIALRLLTPL